MKYKALLLGLLLLAPLLVFMPHASSSSQPVIWVNPSAVAGGVSMEGPLCGHPTFTVQVKLWNKYDLTGDKIYAYDFKVWWYNSTFSQPCGTGTAGDVYGYERPFITLVGIDAESPWANFFVVANESINYLTAEAGGTPQYFDGTDYYDGYHLAITALDSSPPLTDAQVVLVTLTFKVMNEPCFPNVWKTPFTLGNNGGWDPEADCWMGSNGYFVQLSDTRGSPIWPFEADDGQFVLEPGTPDEHMTPDLTTLPWNPGTLSDVPAAPYILEYKIGDFYTFEIWETNMTKAYGFDFCMCYNWTLLTVDAPLGITISPLFPQPYVFLQETTTVPKGHPDQLATVCVTLQRDTSKPLICGTDVNVANVTFESTYLDKYGALPGVYQYPIPFKANSTVTLQGSSMYSYCCGHKIWYLMGGAGVQVSYDQGATWSTPYDKDYCLPWSPLTTIGPALYNNVVDYMWRPIEVKNEYEEGSHLVGVDLNLDGTINIQDLQALAELYGIDITAGNANNPYGVGPQWGNLAHYSYGIVDIYDFVMIAKVFGMPSKDKPWAPALPN